MLGFKKGSSAAIVAANQQLAQRLKPAGDSNGPIFLYKVWMLSSRRMVTNMILCQNMDDMAGYAEAKIISAVIEAVWFEDLKSHGVIFNTLFNPIPLEMFALVMTIVCFLMSRLISTC
jgi:hypothetical protein